MLRQDPDKILVGEIRDLETAEIAVQASLTGHMVFSTLHTNDAPSTITRLHDMGVPPFLITATVEGDPGPAAGAARSACNAARSTRRPRDMLDGVGADARRRARQAVLPRRGLRQSATTPATRAASGLFELMIMNDDMRDMIMRNASTDELRDAGRSSYGMVHAARRRHGRRASTA